MHWCEYTSESDQYYTEDEEDGSPYDELTDILFAHMFGRSYRSDSSFNW